MATPEEIKMKKDAIRMAELKKQLPHKKHLFLHKVDTDQYYSWSPHLALRNDMEEVKEVPEEFQAKTSKPKSSQGKDKYDLMDVNDLKALCKGRDIAVGNTKDEAVLREKLRESDLDD